MSDLSGQRIFKRYSEVTHPKIGLHELLCIPTLLRL